MIRFRWLFWLVLVALVPLGWFAVRGWGVRDTLGKAKEVPHGCQEIVWIQPATSGSTWERFLAGIRRVQQDWPDLQVNDDLAFPDQTVAVPEVALSLRGCEGKLLIRWYKMTSDVGINDWIKELARRDPAPLAVIGGGSSDRARDLALALTDRKNWKGQPPLLLITTATADNVYIEGGITEQPLVEIYPGRTFRFCFTNSQMAAALRSFIWEQPQLRPQGNGTLALGAVAAPAGGSILDSLALLTAIPQLQPGAVHVLAWEDDPYSLDLSNQFRSILPQEGVVVRKHHIRYSVGEYAQPNARETELIRNLLEAELRAPARRLLVLPAGDKPVRRMLRGLTVADPLGIRNVVAVSGDSISFNTICRDRDIAWNIQDMPVPLVLFCHHSPVAWPTQPEPGPQSQTATDDELLNANMVRLLLEGCFGTSPEQTSPGSHRLLDDATELAGRLHARQPAFFGADGNRVGGSGEYVVVLLPHIEAGQVQPRATIEVWSRAGTGAWALVKSLAVDYGARASEGGPVYAP